MSQERTRFIEGEVPAGAGFVRAAGRSIDQRPEDLVSGLSWAEALMRSPEALSFFLEACGKVVLERAGAILEERVVSGAQ